MPALRHLWEEGAGRTPRRRSVAWTNGRKREKHRAVDLRAGREGEVDEEAISVSAHPRTLNAMADPRRKKRAERGGYRISSCPFWLPAIVGTFVLRPRPAKIVEEHAAVVRTSVEVDGAPANRAAGIGIDVTFYCTAVVPGPPERGSKVVCRKAGHASPAAAAASGVTTEATVATVRMVTGVAHSTHQRGRFDCVTG